MSEKDNQYNIQLIRKENYAGTNKINKQTEKVKR